MKKIDSDIKFGAGVTVAIFIFFAILISVCWFSETLADNYRWNDGNCRCGGEWVYEQAVGHGYNSVGYLYHCDKCGKIIQIGERR